MYAIYVQLYDSITIVFCLITRYEVHERYFIIYLELFVNLAGKKQHNSLIGVQVNTITCEDINEGVSKPLHFFTLDSLQGTDIFFSLMLVISSNETTAAVFPCNQANNNNNNIYLKFNIQKSSIDYNL